MDERLLKPDEVAKILQVSKAFAYVLLKRGEIPSMRIGNLVRVRRVDLENYIGRISEQDYSVLPVRTQ